MCCSVFPTIIADSSTILQLSLSRNSTNSLTMNMEKALESCISVCREHI